MPTLVVAGILALMTSAIAQTTAPSAVATEFEVASIKPNNSDTLPPLNGLADRFKLALRRETRQLPVYELTPGRNGLKIFTAVEEQLGLRLRSTTGPVDVLVVDQVERASPN